MADPQPPKLLASIVIVTGQNDGIRADDSGDAFTIAIPAGTYYISDDYDGSTDLLEAIADELNGDGTDSWEVGDNAGVVFIGCDAAWSVDWTHGDSTFDGAILGYDASAATSGGAGVNTSAADQHQYGWYGVNPVASDNERAWESPISQSEGAGFALHTVTVGAVSWLRSVTEPGYKAIEDDDYTNQSWQAFRDIARDGRLCRYYEDATVDAYDTVRLEPGTFEPDRYAQGVALYSWPIVMREGD